MQGITDKMIERAADAVAWGRWAGREGMIRVALEAALSGQVVVDLSSLEELADRLGGGDLCAFWACEGPDSDPEDMITCRVCWVTHDLRALLAAAREARRLAEGGEQA